MKKNTEKDIYNESVLGEPEINKKALKKENDEFLKSDTKYDEKMDILFNKIVRIEKAVYYLVTATGFAFFVLVCMIIMYH